MMCLPNKYRAAAQQSRSGFVLITVLMVLLALLVLTAPYLTTARNADRASSQLADRAQARVSLDAAARHARANLGRSHPSLDPTPDSDSLEELQIKARFDPAFLEAQDARGASWDLEVEDVAGRIDLETAPPQLLANLWGLGTRLTEAVAPGSTTLPVVSTRGLDPAGILVVEGEWIRYGAQETEDFQQKVTGLTRGLGAVELEDEQWTTDGPLPPGSHGVGAHALDQRTFAPVLWRLYDSNVEPRRMDSMEELQRATDFVLDGELGQDFLRVLRDSCTVHADVGAVSEWQLPTRLVAPVIAGETLTLRVQDGRWFGMGSTVRISQGGVSELRYVSARQGSGRITLNAVLESDYQAFEALVEVQVRRPVNLNTARRPVLMALFENLQISGRNDRITLDEAADLAALTMASRPFKGFEDWLRRVVLPAAGIELVDEESGDAPKAVADWEFGDETLIDPMDGVALYLNGLNANDARLEFSTLPFCFTNNAVYRMELRAAVSAPSGVARTSAVRERTELIVPQEELLFLFHRQQDFDEALRLGRRAAWMVTGPNNTSRYDGTSNPPSRSIPHLGTRNGSPYIPGISEPALDDAGEVIPAEHVFANREEGGWVQLAPARTITTPRINGHTMRFDNETRSLEGRYLPDQTIRRDPASNLLAWTSQQEQLLMRAVTLSLWVKPRVVGDSTILDLGGVRTEADRVTLAIEGADLVLRVLDGFGDHPNTPLVERTEARFLLAGANVPGLPADTWSHIEIDVAGSRPDQIGMRVNGTAHGVRVLSMSRTTSLVQGDSQLIPVESTDGFPDTGVARIGNEMFEYTLSGSNALRVDFNPTGPLAGFGGRLARTQHTTEWDPSSLPLELAVNGVGDPHPAGTLVQVYGYSAQLASNLPAGGSALSSDLGNFRVARVMEVTSGVPENITAGLSQGGHGLGLEADIPTATLRLGLGDDGGENEGSDVMQGFNVDGGYALLVQNRWFVGDASDPANGVSAKTNEPLGGAELVRYSGWSGEQIFITRRAAEVEFQNLDLTAGGGDLLGGARVFVMEWNPSRTFNLNNQSVIAATLMSVQTYLIPVSIHVPGASDLMFLPSVAPGQSEFAQFTHVDAGELTEWVRYDHVQTQFEQLVRGTAGAYQAVYRVLTDGAPNETDIPNPNGGGGGSGGGGGGGGGNQNGGGAQNGGLASSENSGGSTYASEAALTAPESSVPAVLGAYWEPNLGVNEIIGMPLTRAVASALHFRGVLGTFSHAHPAGTPVLPVFQVPRGSLGYGVDQGRPGSGDHIFLSDSNPGNPGLPATIHRAHTPAINRPLFNWQQPDYDEFISTEKSAASAQAGQGQFAGRTYVALRDPSPLLLPANEAGGGAPNSAGGGGASGNTAGVFTDTRLRGRLSKWPSGERPRQVRILSIGGSAATQGTGPSSGADIPSMEVDEIIFGSSTFGVGVGTANPRYATQGGSLVLVSPLGDGDSDLRVGPNFVRTVGLSGQQGSVLGGGDGLPEDAGLLRLGEEILCYDARDVDGGVLRIAVDGRGLLGTRQHHHAAGDSAQFLDHIPVSVLSGDIGPGEALLPLASTADFPEEGLVLIGTELIHYTRLRSGGLEMPRGSGESGIGDDEGAGIFRGRFGTSPQSHVGGTPVILFPFRYWDRWTDRTDAPELAYFGLELNQPGALWEGLFFETEPSTHGQAQLGVLQRTNPLAAWDADPSSEDGLDLFYQGDANGQPLPLGLRSDRIEWRIFVRYDPGAFDPVLGLTHGWKETPRLKQLAATYLAPGRVLRSVDR